MFSRSQPEKLKESKIKMNILYKAAFVLFVLCFCFLIAAMVICLVEDAEKHDSFLAILFSCISGGMALLGIIFACASKERRKKKKTFVYAEDKSVLEEQDT